MPPAPTTHPLVVEGRKVMGQMRKWNCYFERKDVYSFLERVEELRLAYGVEEGQLIQGLADLLCRDALHWYRSVASECTSWADFEEKL